MAMRATTVRFAAATFEEVAREAALEGMPISEYIREATLLVVAHRRSQRGAYVDLDNLGLKRGV